MSGAEIFNLFWLGSMFVSFVVVVCCVAVGSFAPPQRFRPRRNGRDDIAEQELRAQTEIMRRERLDGLSRQYGPRGERNWR